MSASSKHSLLLLGHGSSKHPESSRSVRMHAEVLLQRDCFDEVHVAFLKEEPLIQDAWALIDSEKITIVPDFLAEGYFTRQVIPELLNLKNLPDGVTYCDPVGTHPLMGKLIEDAASDVLGDWQAEDVSLLLVGHGSTKNSKSKESLLEHIKVLRETTDFAQIHDLWLEEDPFVSNWKQVTAKKKVIVVPFLLSDGQHGGWDVPEMLGLEKGGEVHGITHEVEGCKLRVTSALGSSSRFVDVIVAQGRTAL
jgi:sirohydrochlorin cobaltochelatase